MASTAAVAARVYRDMQAAQAVVEAQGSPERRQRLLTFYTPAPTPNRNPVEFAAYQSEILAGLAELVEGLLTPTVAAAATSKRGRPRKTAAPEATSQDAGMDRPGEEAVATD